MRYVRRRSSMVEDLVNFFVGLAEVVLLLRVVFRLFAANQAAAFVNWIYDTSDFLLAPFRGIFPVETISPGHVLDLPAIFAMVMYALVGFLIISLVNALDRGEVVETKRVDRR